MNELLLALLALGVCVSAWRLAFCAGAPAGEEARYSNALHILMNGSMAFMMIYWTAFVEGAVLVLYVIAGGLLSLRIRRDLRNRTGNNDARRRARLAGGWYHLVALAAMAFCMGYMPPSAMAMPMPAPAHTVQHTWAAMLLGGLFSLDALLSTATVVFFPEALLRLESAALSLGVEVPEGGDAPRDHGLHAALRWSLVPHFTMDVGMVAMLLGHGHL